MTVVKSIGVISYGKVSAVISAIFGLFYGLIAALIFSMASIAPGAGAIMAGLGIVSIIAFPILFAFLGFIGGVISAIIYNLVAGWVGGVEVELQ